MRHLVLAVVLALAVTAVPAATAARHHRHGAKSLRGHAHRGRAKVPVHWRFEPRGGAAPAPAAGAGPAAPGPTASPAPGGPAPGGPSPTATPAPTATPDAPALPGADPHSVSVVSREWSFTLSQPTVVAGPVHVQFDNSRAEDAHELGITGSGGPWDFGKQDAGTVTHRSITLAPGTYTFFCPLPGHEAAGMKTVLKVVAG